LARLVVVSNRVAIPDGKGGGRAGGLEVAVKAAFRHRQGVWFGWSGKVARKGDAVATTTVRHGDVDYVTTSLRSEDYEEYYNGFANRVLWPVLHYRFDLTEFSRRDLSGYMRVNEHFASELDKILRPDDIVWVHDYHLIPLAGMLRARGRGNRIGYFLHIPCPPPEVLTALPNHERLIPTLEQYDLVGFQTGDDAFNFSRYLTRERGLHSRDFCFAVGDREVRVDAFPVGIETEQFAKTARRAIKSEFVQNVIGSLNGRPCSSVSIGSIISKGLNLRLDAYDQFLRAYVDWRGKVTYLQITRRLAAKFPSTCRWSKWSARAPAISTAPMARRTGRRSAMSTCLQPHGACGFLSRFARRTGDAAARRHEPRRQGVHRGAGSGRSRRAGAVALCRRGARMQGSAAGQPLRYRGGGRRDRPRAGDAAGERRERHKVLFETLMQNDIAHWAERFITTLTRRRGSRTGRSGSAWRRTDRRRLSRRATFRRSGNPNQSA